jgi:homoserine dehydrogenase
MTIKTHRLILAGLGNVNRSLLGILQSQAALLRERYGLAFVIVGAADSGVTALDLARTVDADALLEATPVNLRDGQPGLDVVRAALGRGIACVLANKGPLALAYAELAAISDLASRGMGDKCSAGGSYGWGVEELPHQPASSNPPPLLRFSACVGGLTPTLPTTLHQASVYRHRRPGRASRP